MEDWGDSAIVVHDFQALAVKMVKRRKQFAANFVFNPSTFFKALSSPKKNQPNLFLFTLSQTADGVDSKVMDDYCWIHSTFHIRDEYQGKNLWISDIVDTL